MKCITNVLCKGVNSKISVHHILVFPVIKTPTKLPHLVLLGHLSSLGQLICLSYPSLSLCYWIYTVIFTFYQWDKYVDLSHRVFKPSYWSYPYFPIVGTTPKKVIKSWSFLIYWLWSLEWGVVCPFSIIWNKLSCPYECMWNMKSNWCTGLIVGPGVYCYSHWGWRCIWHGEIYNFRGNC